MNLKIALLLFDNYTALDVVGPYEVLARIPNALVYLVGPEKRQYKDKFGLTLLADYSLNEVPEADVLLIPGGPGIDTLLSNRSVIEWVKKLHNTTKWTTSVCSGALILAEAGLLEGKKCTTHWRRKEQLRKYNVSIVDERYVEDDKFITSAGVSAGIDMALFLASKITNKETAEIIQLQMEYDPLPPFNAGSLSKASKTVIEKVLDASGKK